jgi:hypothetical protein
LRLQLEQHELRFKISVDDKDKTVRLSKRDAWTQALLDAAQSAGIPLRKPGGPKTGDAMTAATVDCEYRKEKDGIIEIGSTVGFLHEIESLMDEAFGKCP